MNKILTRQYQLKFLFCLCLTIVSSSISVLAVYFIGEVLTYAIKGQAWNFFKYLLLSFGASMLTLLLNYTSSIIKMTLSNRIIYDLRKKVLNNAFNYVGNRLEIDAGDFDSVIRNNIKSIVQKRLSSLYVIISSTTTLIASFSLIFYYSWVAGVIVMPLVVLTIFIPFLVGKKMNAWYEKIIKEKNNFSSKIEHETAYVKSYKFLNAIAVARRKILGINNDYEVVMSNYYKKMIPLTMMMILAAVVFQVLIQGISGVLYVDGFISIAAFTTIGFLMGNASAGVQELINSIPEYKLSISQFKDKVKISNLHHRNNCEIEGLELRNFNVKINGDNFYEIAKNLKFENNKKYLLSGKNGSGKSLLLHSLFTFNGIVGDVLINNEIAEKDWYVNRAWMLPSLPKIFDGSVSENISLFEEKPNIDKMETLLAEMKLNGINLDSDAISLSDGQKQRIALARALYFEPEWIFLDETLSSIEAESAKAIILLVANRVPSLIMVSHHKIMDEGWFDHEIKIN